MFIVFSQRHKKDIENKTLKVTMPMQIREQTLKVKKYYQTWYETNETGWNYSTSIEDEVLSDLKVFYKLKAYNYKNDLVEVKDFDSFYLRCTLLILLMC